MYKSFLSFQKENRHFNNAIKKNEDDFQSNFDQFLVFLKLNCYFNFIAFKRTVPNFEYPAISDTCYVS